MRSLLRWVLLVKSFTTAGLNLVFNVPAACLTASPGGVPAVRVFLLLSLIIYINIDIVNKNYIYL